MGALATVLTGVIVVVLADEFRANAPAISYWLIRRAAQRLPGNMRDRYCEEWLAHADECPGNLSKLYHAIGCRFRAGRLLEADILTRTERLFAFILTCIMRWAIVTGTAKALAKGERVHHLPWLWRFTRRLGRLSAVRIVRQKRTGKEAAAEIHKLLEPMLTQLSQKKSAK